MLTVLVKLAIQIERKMGFMSFKIVIGLHSSIGLQQYVIEPYKRKTKIIGLLSSSFMTDRL